MLEKNEFYRSNYASTGNEILTEVCLPKDEPAINFSQLNQHCTGHEKIEQYIAAWIKTNFYRLF